MPSDLTVLVPRKSLDDARWNTIQDYTRTSMGDTPYVTGFDRKPDAPFFSMSRALNDARKHATTPKLIVTPCDYIFPPHVLDLVSAVLDVYPWWHPLPDVHRLSEEDTEEVLAGRLTPTLHIKPAEHTHVCMSVIAMRTDVWDDIKGFDPRFEGYAPEDFAVQMKLMTLHGKPPAPQPLAAIELHTDRSAKANYEVTGPWFDRNYRRARRSPSLMRAFINNQPDE